jgi:hypothetical protein
MLLRMLLGMLAVFVLGALFAWSLERRRVIREGFPGCDEHGCGSCSAHCHERTEGNG